MFLTEQMNQFKNLSHQKDSTLEEKKKTWQMTVIDITVKDEWKKGAFINPPIASTKPNQFGIP